MNKTPYLFSFILILLLNVVYQSNKGAVLWKYEEKEQTPDIIIHDNSTSINCRKLLLKYRSMLLNDNLLKSLTENCFEHQRTRIEMVLNKQFLKEIFGRMSCPETKPQFLNESGHLVALASVPGSGSTWSRVILETITGIYTTTTTGTLLNSPESRLCPTTAGVLIVNTQGMSIISGRWRRSCSTNIKFSRAIFILRNPYDAIMTEYSRRAYGKGKFVDREGLIRDTWIKFVEKQSEKWKTMALFWLTLVNIPVHVLVYEDMKANPMLETYKMMDFLNLNVTFKSLYCLLNKPLEVYYRSNNPNWLNKTQLYNRKMKEFVNTNIMSVYLIVNASRYVDTLKSYIISDAKLL